MTWKQLGITFLVMAALIVFGAFLLSMYSTSDKKAVTVNVPDTVRVCDTIYTVDTIKVRDTMYWIAGDSIFSMEPYYIYGLDTRVSRDGARRYREVLLEELYPESLSACRALRSRYESQARELKEKLDHLKCEGR